MKLFIWNHPYSVSYGASFLYVVAESEEAARELMDQPVPRYTYGEHEEPPLTFNHKSLGQPTRVVELPCAEIYEWSE